MATQRRRRDDGYKKIDKLILTSPIEGNVEYELFFNRNKTECFVITVDQQDVYGPTVEAVRKKGDSLLAARGSLTWERWIEIDYSARLRDIHGSGQHKPLNEAPDDEVEAEAGDVIDEICFSFRVFEILSDFEMSEEAKRVHRARAWGGEPDRQRLLRRAEIVNGAWKPERDHEKVDGDYLDKKGTVRLPFDEQRYAALVAIRDALRGLDARLREVLTSPDLHKLVLGPGGPLALPAAEPPAPRSRPDGDIFDDIKPATTSKARRKA